MRRRRQSRNDSRRLGHLRYSSTRKLRYLTYSASVLCLEELLKNSMLALRSIMWTASQRNQWAYTGMRTYASALAVSARGGSEPGTRTSAMDVAASAAS